MAKSPLNFRCAKSTTLPQTKGKSMSAFKQTVLAGLCATVTLVGAATSAHAGNISIDFTKLASGTAITNQYTDVTFSLSGGNASGKPTIASYGAGLSNSPTAGSYPTAEFLIAEFAAPVSGVSFTFNNEGFNGGNRYVLEDTKGNILTSGFLSGYTYNLSSYSNVSEIIWDNGYSTGRYSWTQALSTLNYTVPEPASLTLLGLGMFGTGVIARRRKSTPSSTPC